MINKRLQSWPSSFCHLISYCTIGATIGMRHLRQRYLYEKCKNFYEIDLCVFKFLSKLTNWFDLSTLETNIFFTAVCCKIIHESVMSIYSDKLAHVQVIINSRYFIAQMCAHEDTLAQYLGVPY